VATATIGYCAFLFIKMLGGGIVKLTAKQKRFCDEYLIDCNATQAAIRAGYSERTAYSTGNENLKKPELKTYIEEQLEKMHNEKTADAQEVLEYLTAVMRGQHTEQTLQLVGEGVQSIADIDVSAKERLKAAELLGKRYGLFTDKLEVDGVAKVVINGEEDLDE
jgi:phage terminase small subunit